MIPYDCRSVVRLFEKESGSFYDISKPYAVAVADQRPLATKDESLFESVSATSTRCTWNIWTETITASWDADFDPWSLAIESEWLVKEANGDEWIIVSVGNGLLGAHWKCQSYLYYGEPIIGI